MMIYLMNLKDNKKLINLLAVHNYSFRHIENELSLVGRLEEACSGLIVHKESLILIDGYELDPLLKLLRDNQISCDYKAVMTEYNRRWTVFELMNELCMEKLKFMEKRNV